MNLLRHRRGEHSGIRSGISRHLLLIKLLSDPQRLIGADLEKFGTVVLQLCQIIQERRIPGLLLFLQLLHHRNARRLLLQITDKGVRIFFLQKSVIFIEQR